MSILIVIFIKGYIIYSLELFICNGVKRILQVHYAIFSANIRDHLWHDLTNANRIACTFSEQANIRMRYRFVLFDQVLHAYISTAVQLECTNILIIHGRTHWVFSDPIIKVPNQANMTCKHYLNWSCVPIGVWSECMVLVNILWSYA